MYGGGGRVDGTALPLGAYDVLDAPMIAEGSFREESSCGIGVTGRLVYPGSCSTGGTGVLKVAGRRGRAEARTFGTTEAGSKA